MEPVHVGKLFAPLFPSSFILYSSLNLSKLSIPFQSFLAKLCRTFVAEFAGAYNYGSFLISWLYSMIDLGLLRL